MQGLNRHFPPLNTLLLVNLRFSSFSSYDLEISPTSCLYLSDRKNHSIVTETIIDTAPGDLEKSPQVEVESYPLDGVELDSVSNEDLAKLLFTAPVLYEAGSNRIVRISKGMVLKGSGTVSKCEGETQRFAAAHGLQVPTVHRIFSLIGFYPGWPEETDWFMVMDFVPGTSLEDAWTDLDTAARESVTAEVAEMINRMQSLDLGGMPPGPVGHEGNGPWRGPYFTAYGTGPFRTLKKMEDWYNHKLDVCIRLTQAKADVPRFAFERAVLTHQDIAPRNLVIRDEDQKICLIDFGMSGIYPVGFEQAALARQALGKWDKEFREMILSKLAYRGDLELRQLRNVMYGLTTGVLL